MGGVSCSTVCPNDVFYGTERNAIGCIGLVLDLIEPESIVATSPDDCGSIEVNGIRTVEREVDIFVTDIENSITKRQPGSYNEWVLRNFKVLGVLAVSPFEIFVTSRLILPEGLPDHLVTNEEVIGVGNTTLAKVKLQFPELPVYTFHQGHIIGVPRHSDIYRV